MLPYASGVVNDLHKIVSSGLLFTSSDMPEIHAKKVTGTYSLTTDLDDDRLLGKKERLLRAIDFLCGANAGFGDKDYIDHRDYEALTKKTGLKESSLKQYLWQMDKDGVLIKYKSPNRPDLFVINKKSGVARLARFIAEDDNIAKRKADAKAARAARRAETAAMARAYHADTLARKFAPPPPPDTAVFGDDPNPYSTPILADQTQKDIKDFRKDIEDFQIFIYANESKSPSLLLFVLNSLLSSSSAGFCVESGSMDDDDPDPASLVKEPDAQALAGVANTDQDQDAGTAQDADQDIFDDADPFADDPAPIIVRVHVETNPSLDRKFAEDEDHASPPPSPCAVINALPAVIPAPHPPTPPAAPSDAYSAQVASLIEEFCLDKFRPAALHTALAHEFQGASDATRLKIVIEASRRLHARIDQGHPIGTRPLATRWNYFLVIVKNQVELAKKEHASKPMIHLAPAAPAASLTKAQEAQARAAVDALDDAAREALTLEAKAIMAKAGVPKCQRDSQGLVNKRLRDLMGERMGFPVNQDWKKKSGD